METKTFSFQRYIQLFKTQLGENWKRHLIVTLVFVLLMTLAFAFQNFFLGILGKSDGGDEINVFIMGVRAISGTFIPLSILVLMLIYHAAHSMPFIATKTRSLSYIFLPSTIAEKFCVALTFIFVITFIEWCAVFFLSDIIQYIMGGEMMVLSSFMRVDLISGMSTLFEPTSASGFYESYSSEDISVLEKVFGLQPRYYYTMILSPLVYVSAYFVGANFFRQHPFLLTTLALWGISSIVGMIRFGFIAAFGGVETYLNPFFFISTGYLTYYYISRVLLMIGLFTLSYYRMKRLSL